MIAILWRYRVRPEARSAFERAYGPEGEWAALFRRAEGYAGTELLRGAGDSWITVDRWRSRSDFDAFMAAHRSDYEALDRAAEGWTLAERRLGTWDVVPGARP